MGRAQRDEYSTASGNEWPRQSLLYLTAISFGGLPPELSGGY